VLVKPVQQLTSWSGHVEQSQELRYQFAWKVSHFEVMVFEVAALLMKGLMKLVVKLLKMKG